MALRVKCRCGKALKISSQHAGKKLACPGCKRPFLIPADKFAQAESRASARAPTPTRATAGAAAPKPSAASTSIASSPATFPAPSELDLAAEFAHSQSDVLRDLVHDAESAKSESIAPAVIPVHLESVPVDYVRDPTRSTPLPGRTKLDTVQGPVRGFWADAFRSFIYPFRGYANTVVFVIIAVIACIPMLLAFAPLIGGFGQLIIFGWLAGLYFSVICDTATGQEDLPGITMQDGFVDDVLKPAFKYIGANAIVLALACILAALVIFSAVSRDYSVMIPIWFVVGLFLLPMSLMLFAFNATSMIVRLDLIFVTIFRTFLPYLAMWAMLLVVGILYLAGTVGSWLVKMRIGGFLPDFTQEGMAINAALRVVDVYLTIVAMRLIGLYYLHYKKRFAIIME